MLLPLLDAVRTTGPGRWIARCPAHYDKTPSLSIRETGDGTLLIRCWAGCSAADVVRATGLSLVDLFPRRHNGRGPLRRGERWIPHDVVACLAREALVVAIAGDDIAAGRPLSDADRERVRGASIRLRSAAMEVGHE